MKNWKSLAFGIGALTVATATIVPTYRHSRSVQPLAEVVKDSGTGFDPDESTGLFIGVGRYQDSDIVEVPYAVDDAIDLA